MSITIDVSEEIAAAIQASPDGMERARHLLESEFGDEMYVDPAEGEDREDLIAKVNAALADPDPGVSPEEADARLEERLPWLKVRRETTNAA